MGKSDEDDKSFGPRLVATYSALSDADKSVLIAAVQGAASQMMTPKGSPNDVFWRMLSEVGWTEEVEVPEDSFPIEVASWRLTELGRISVPILIKKSEELNPTKH